MQTMEVEVLSNAVNAAIIRLPNRAYPGVVIQGDSLNILYRLAEAIKQEFQNGDDKEELEESINELIGLLSTYRSVYETTVKEHNLTLPYSKASSE